jgi:hypothetical protein
VIREALLGTTAGAVSTVALNAVTYGDMVLRGRPASGVPAQVAGKLAEKAGLDLSAEGEGSEGDTAQNRRSGLGALSGYIVGLGVGTAYGLVRPHLRNVSKVRAGVVLGLAALAGSDVPATVLDVTNPVQWGPNSWVSDIVPHLAYGVTTALAYDALTSV